MKPRCPETLQTKKRPISYPGIMPAKYRQPISAPCISYENSGTSFYEEATTNHFTPEHYTNFVDGRRNNSMFTHASGFHGEIFLLGEFAVKTPLRTEGL